MAASGSVQAKITGTQTKAAEIGTLSMTATVNKGFALTGTRYDKILEKAGSLDTTGETIDLQSFNDEFGDATVLTQVHAAIIVNTGDTNNLLVGGAAATAWLGILNDASDVIKLPPGAWLMFGVDDADGIPVAAGSKSLKICAAASTTTYQLLLLGTE